ncbi:MAG: hypothetical protein WBB19_10205 [Desulforhopalus sp.]
MAQKTQDTTNWPEMFVSLYDRLTGNNAEIAYAFDDFKIDVPSSTAEDAPQAHWRFNGTMRITTREKSH